MKSTENIIVDVVGSIHFERLEAGFLIHRQGREIIFYHHPETALRGDLALSFEMA